MIKKGLGKGLEALITSNETENLNGDILELRINDIEPNFEQPRKNFNDEKLQSLAESIKQYGVVQPLVVKKENGSYKIIAGERRWRAARIAGLETVPVIIKDVAAKQTMEIALIENLQREDLNPIEEAMAYEKLIKEFNMTQEEIASVVGKSRPAVANSLRLLNLDDKIREMIASGKISSGHARALLSLENVELQIKMAEEIVRKDLNVRDAEKLAKLYLSRKTAVKRSQKNEELIEVEEKLKDFFGTKVKLITNKNRGKIMIEYYSNEELERILELVDSLSQR